MMTNDTRDAFAHALRTLPLVAILRGIRPDEAVSIGRALVDTGWQLIEVPLNSPQPLASIAALTAAVPAALVGAGTVLTSAQVREIAEKKMKDLNCDTVEAAMKMVEGSARSMGLQVAE